MQLSRRGNYANQTHRWRRREVFLVEKQTTDFLWISKLGEVSQVIIGFSWSFHKLFHILPAAE